MRLLPLRRPSWAGRGRSPGEEVPPDCVVLLGGILPNFLPLGLLPSGSLATELDPLSLSIPEVP